MQRRLTESDARRVLAPYHDDLVDVINGAWRRWAALSEQDRAALAYHARARANAINAFMLDDARRRFSPPEARPFDSEGTTVVVFGDEILLRFKKLDADGFSRNYATQRSFLWNVQSDLPGIPSLGRVDAGYVVNSLGTGPDQILVAHRDGHQIDWVYRLWDSADGIVSVPQVPTAAPAAPAAATPRIKRRSVIEEAK